MRFFDDKKDMLWRPELLEDSLNTSVHSRFATDYMWEGGGIHNAIKSLCLLAISPTAEELGMLRFLDQQLDIVKPSTEDSIQTKPGVYLNSHLRLSNIYDMRLCLLWTVNKEMEGHYMWEGGREGSMMQLRASAS